MAAAVDLSDAQGAVIALFGAVLPVLMVMLGIRKITKTANRT
jgi:hypothetical protein|tara:strand:- start:9553 stop:9678 length:126 start_codon:yes stop_codon:yes gene_type:complete